MKNKKILLYLALCLVMVLVGCSGKSLKENEIEYKGVIFQFEDTEGGVKVVSVTPNKGDYLEFPNKINDKQVVDVDGACVMDYTEIKFAGVKSGRTVELPVTEKISFNDDAVVTSKNLYQYAKRSLKEVKLPSNITEIKNEQFKFMPELETVDLNNVELIKAKGFIGCNNLKTVNAPKLTTVNNEAFWDCANLETVNAPELTTVYEKAFKNCENLETVNAPKLTTIYEEAFISCKSLTSIDLSNVEELGGDAFKDCQSLSGDIVFKKMQQVYVRAFEGCSSINSFKFEQKIDCTDINDIYIGLVCPGLKAKVIVNGEEYRTFKSIEADSILIGDSYEGGYNIDFREPYAWPKKEEFKNKIVEIFLGKTFYKGESLSLQDIMPVINMMPDDGNLLYNGPGGRAYASKYQLVEWLTYDAFMEEKERNKIKLKDWKEQYLPGKIIENDYYVYEYAPLDKNKVFKNDAFDVICFGIYECDDGDFFLDSCKYTYN